MPHPPRHFQPGALFQPGAHPPNPPQHCDQPAWVHLDAQAITNIDQHSCIHLDEEFVYLTWEQMLRLLCTEQRLLKQRVEELLQEHLKTSTASIERLLEQGFEKQAEKVYTGLTVESAYCQAQNGVNKDEACIVPYENGVAHHDTNEPTTPVRKGRRSYVEPRVSQRVSLMSEELQKELANLKKKRFDKAHKHQVKEEESEAEYQCELSRRIGYIVNHAAFDGCAALVIVCNAILIAISVDHLTYHSEEEPWMIVATHICNLFFFIELALRITSQGLHFCTNEEKSWNAFDSLLVAFSLFETFGPGGDVVDAGSSMKTLKIVRIVRIFRVFRFFRDLTLIAHMIASSLKSLIWAWILICIIQFTFSIYFTQSATEFLSTSDDEDLREKVKTYFGSLHSTFYCLIQTMMAGRSWGEYTDVLLQYDYSAALLFICYVVFMFLAVLNVITGVFVDKAVVSATKQREFMITQEMSIKQKYLMEMKKIFAEIDKDGSGEISLEEARKFFEQEKWSAYFSALGIDASDIELLFAILDSDGSGTLQVEEFVEGCMRLKGAAKRTDCAAILQAVSRLEVLLKRQDRSRRRQPSVRGQPHPNGNGNAGDFFLRGIST